MAPGWSRCNGKGPAKDTEERFSGKVHVGDTEAKCNGKGPEKDTEARCNGNGIAGDAEANCNGKGPAKRQGGKVSHERFRQRHGGKVF